MRKQLHNRLIFLLLALIPVSTMADELSTFTVEALFQKLKKSAPQHLSFREIKTLSYLDVKLEQLGTLEFLPPDTIRREVNKPEYEITLIEGDTVTISSRKKTKTIDINSHPAISALVNAFRAPLTGDLKSLSESFHIKLTGSEKSWTLTMTPAKNSISTYLSEIILTGTFDQLLSIETVDRNEDTTYLILTPQE